VGAIVTGVPLVTVTLPGVIMPIPLPKVGVSVADPPIVILAAVAEVVKLVIEGSGTVLEVPTLIDTVLTTETPEELVTVSV
jgi:hypothetical protein